MDLKAYFKKVREAEATMPDGDVVLVSLATPEGGKADVRSEAPRTVAARCIAEGRARLATAKETSEFRAELKKAKQAWEAEEAGRRVQVVMVPVPNPAKKRLQPKAEG